jgi:hypothetical protein
MAGGIFLLAWVLIYVRSGLWFLCSVLLTRCVVIALVEYLTSEEVGQPLGSRFAWPLGYILNTRGKTPSLNTSKYADELNMSANKALKKVNGVGTPKHANGTTNVPALFGAKNLKTS